MIPNKIHFCFGFGDESEEFQFAHYLAVKSAVTINQPEVATLWFSHKPTGAWWERACTLATPKQVTAPTHVFGIPLRHYAHRADVFRLDVLIEEGGIYLDVDTLCLKPFTPLLEAPAVLAQQLSRDGSIRGLGNAVILAEPQSVFLKAWKNGYRTFRSTGRHVFWDEHSVKVPSQMASLGHLRPHIIVLPDHLFYFPNFNNRDILLRPLLSTDDLLMARFTRSYCIHLWEQIDPISLSDITPGSVRTGGNVYGLLAQRFVDEY